MCNWQEISVRKIHIEEQTVRDTCKIIHQTAKKKEKITYSELMCELKKLNHHAINRGTIGAIVGEVSMQVSESTKPSVYPSAIVIRKDTDEPGEGFWGLDSGTHPPDKVARSDRKSRLSEYQQKIFNNSWGCDCV